MAEKVILWGDGERMRLYLQVLCPNCEEQVSITGRMEEGAIIMEDCPLCGSPFVVEVKAGDLGEADEQTIKVASAEVTWHLEGGNFPLCTMHVRPDTDVATVLVAAVSSGVSFFGGGPFNPALLYTEIVRRICVMCIDNEHLEKLALMIADILQQRKAGPLVVKGTSGGNGHDEESSEHLKSKIPRIIKKSDKEEE